VLNGCVRVLNECVCVRVLNQRVSFIVECCQKTFANVLSSRDMRSFGGKGIMKQCCVKRQCLYKSFHEKRSDLSDDMPTMVPRRRPHALGLGSFPPYVPNAMPDHRAAPRAREQIIALPPEFIRDHCRVPTAAATTTTIGNSPILAAPGHSIQARRSDASRLNVDVSSSFASNPTAQDSGGGTGGETSTCIATSSSSSDSSVLLCPTTSTFAESFPVLSSNYLTWNPPQIILTRPPGRPNPRGESHSGPTVTRDAEVCSVARKGHGARPVDPVHSKANDSRVPVAASSTETRLSFSSSASEIESSPCLRPSSVPLKLFAARRERRMSLSEASGSFICYPLAGSAVGPSPIPSAQGLGVTSSSTGSGSERPLVVTSPSSTDTGDHSATATQTANCAAPISNSTPISSSRRPFVNLRSGLISPSKSPPVETCDAALSVVSSSPNIPDHSGDFSTIPSQSGPVTPLQEPRRPFVDPSVLNKGPGTLDELLGLTQDTAVDACPNPLSQNVSRRKRKLSRPEHLGSDEGALVQPCGQGPMMGRVQQHSAADTLPPASTMQGVMLGGRVSWCLSVFLCCLEKCGKNFWSLSSLETVWRILFRSVSMEKDNFSRLDLLTCILIIFFADMFRCD